MLGFSDAPVVVVENDDNVLDDNDDVDDDDGDDAVSTLKLGLELWPIFSLEF